MLNRSVLLMVLVGSLVIMMTGCPTPENQPYPNSLPDTRLANVPDNDTIGVNIGQGFIPEQTLFWVGDDPDGYIVGYRYRWIDAHRNAPDTTAWTTLINLTNLAGSPLDTFMIVHPRATSLYRIYNYFATIRSSENTRISAIQDLLATGRYFAVPYNTGPVDGDSVRGADPVQIEAPNKGTFIFNSPADSNRHRFEVKAVDNSDAEDPTPAQVNFWTTRSPGPIVSVASGGSMTTPAFVIRCPTQAAPGITFTFAGFDASTNDREFSWTVDDSTINWSGWSVEPRAIVTAANLLETGTDTHTIYVRGRNRWGVISAVAWRNFRAWIPGIDDIGVPKRLLVFINTRDADYPRAPFGAIDSNAIMAFYGEILDSLGLAGRYDILNRHRGGAFPWIDRRLLGQYSAVLLVADSWITGVFGGSQWVLDADKQGNLREYLNVGGKLIWSGSPMVQSLFAGGGYPFFAFSVFHTANPSFVTPFREDPEPNFIGAIGRSGYPNLTLDPAKVPPDSLGIRYISTHYPSGFGETIYEWNHRTGNIAFQNVPLGIRYQGMAADPGPYCRETYSVVYFGFPLYFVNKSQAIQAMRKALQDINEY
jgi:hypothetical protein